MRREQESKQTNKIRYFIYKEGIMHKKGQSERKRTVN
jgi:hypothetical protein